MTSSRPSGSGGATRPLLLDGEHVVDSDVISFLFKPHDTRAALYQPEIQGLTVVISFQTLAELLRWPLERRWGAGRRARWEATLKRFVVQPWGWDLCQRWAQVRADCKRIGHAIDTADAWQAATARHLELPLLTHNRRHFQRVPGLSVISHAPR